MFDQTRKENSQKDNPQKQWQLNEISVPKSAGLGSEWQFVRENLIISAQDLKELLNQQMEESLKFFEKARDPIYSFYTFNFSGSVVIDSLFGKILGVEEFSMYYGFFLLNYTNFIGSHFGSFDDPNQLDFVDEEYAEKLRLDQYLQARQNLIDRDLHISSFCDDLIPRAKKRLVIANIKFWQQLATDTIDTISIAQLE